MAVIYQYHNTTKLAVISAKMNMSLIYEITKNIYPVKTEHVNTNQRVNTKHDYSGGENLEGLQNPVKTVS